MGAVHLQSVRLTYPGEFGEKRVVRIADHLAVCQKSKGVVTFMLVTINM